MNQVAPPESRAGPGGHAGDRDADKAPDAGCLVRRGRPGPHGRVGAPPGLARAAIGRGRRADGRARYRQRSRPGDRGLDRADGGARHLAGVARGGPEGVLRSARRDAAARRDVVRPLGPGTAAAEHAPAIRRLAAAARRLQCREPGSHTSTPSRHARPWSARWSGGSWHRRTSSRSRSPSWPTVRSPT